MTGNGVTIAAKCAPDRTFLSAIQSAGLSAVELFLNSHWLTKLPEIIPLCRDFQFRYAVHAPIDTFRPDALAEFSAAIGAEIVVFHDIYWDEEWDFIIRSFAGSQVKLCMENVATIHTPVKFMRRFNMGSCLDLEHLQLEVGGVFEEEFLRVMKSASHVHMTGYHFGSRLWHTHIHHSPDHCIHLLNLLKKAMYNGLVVSEARVCYQSRDEFCTLAAFAKEWDAGC